MRRGLIALTLLALVLTAGCSGGSTIGKIKDVATGKTGKDIQEFQNRAEAAKKLTYTAQYDAVSSGNKTSKVRVEQKPPKSLYQQDDSLFIDDGSRTVVCQPDSSNAGKQQCIDVGPTGSNPGTFAMAFSAPSLIAGLSVLAIVPGVTVSHPTRNLAGESLD